MLRISKNASVIVSLCLTVVFFFVLIVASAILPVYIRQWVLPASSRTILSGDATLILCSAYVVLAVAILADILLFRLLLIVRSGEVFGAKSVALIRGVSWCAILIGLMFLVMTYYFLIGLVLAFAAVLVGLCLRVVKNVIEEATAIKSENDLTV